MKCVFLDFDGVLNSRDYIARAERNEPHSEAEARTAVRLRDAVGASWYPLSTAMFDIRSLNPDLVRLVQGILDQTGAKVVISSSWRHGQTIPGLRVLLGFHGLDPEAIIDMTPRNLAKPGAVRGDEIQAWLDTHPEVETICILDDDSDMAHLADKLVRTSMMSGITPENVGKAVGMLGRLESRASAG